MSQRKPFPDPFAERLATFADEIEEKARKLRPTNKEGALTLQLHAQRLRQKARQRHREAQFSASDKGMAEKKYRQRLRRRGEPADTPSQKRRLQ